MCSSSVDTAFFLRNNFQKLGFNFKITVNQNCHIDRTAVKIVLLQLFFHLQPGATWEVDTLSSSQNIRKLIAMMQKEATKEELASLNAHRPLLNKDKSGWRLDLENAAEKIQNRFEIILRKQEEKYGLLNSSKKYVRKMTVTFVGNRFRNIKCDHHRCPHFNVEECSTSAIPEISLVSSKKKTSPHFTPPPSSKK